MKNDQPFQAIVWLKILLIPLPDVLFNSNVLPVSGKVKHLSIK